MEEKQRIILDLNSYPDDQKTNFWLTNQEGCKFGPVEKKGRFEYNWYYFKHHDLWMCRVYDHEQMKDGDGFLSRIIFTSEKQDLTTFEMERPDNRP